MKSLVFRIALEEPLLVTALDGDPNSAVAHDFVPGGVLRGAMVGRYLRSKGFSSLDAADGQVRRLFLDGSTRFLNGYALHPDGVRTLPTPLSWYKRKGMREGELQDFVWGIPDEHSIWEPAREPFCRMIEDDDGDPVDLLHPRRQVAVHIQNDPRRGRPTRRAGSLYRYDALAEGQTFEAAILCDHDGDVDLLQELLAARDGAERLGGAAGAGYGRVRFCESRVLGGDWREAGGALVPSLEGRLVVTLLSDVLVRDETGQITPDPEAFTAHLQRHLGVARLDLEEAFLDTRAVGGFNRRWGLPLPQALALRMGSVFVYQDPGSDLDRLAAVELLGIGERRAEGFGRVAFNWHRSPAWRPLSHGAPKPRRVSLQAGTAGHDLARRMVDRLLRQRLDQGLLRRARHFVKGGSRWPSKSQLGRLLAVADEALGRNPHAGRRVLEDYLDGVQKRQVARQQFETCRVGGTPFLDWLRSRLDDERQVWRDLGVQVEKLPAVGDVTADLTSDLAFEYNLRLVREVLVQAARVRGGSDR